MYKRCSALKNDYEFRRAYGRGRNAVSAGLVVYCLKKKNSGVRVGITTGKKVGNAVLRNRARRIIREAVRLCEHDIRGNWDIVLVARTRTPFLKTQDVHRELRRSLTGMGIITEGQEQK
ncbi:MAG: ribonuclease P protein component [Ruminococcaceae bacterium]|nr:ribonuclease P protein component [Oscillospiraceae bacterium]